jgi:AraC-like DNA-binding protein
MATAFKNRLLFKSNTANPFGRVVEGAVSVNAGWTGETPMRILGTFGIVYVLEGQCRYLQPDGSSRDLVSGDMMVLFPDVPHRYGPVPGYSWSHLYITFEGPAFNFWREHGILDPSRFVYHLHPVEYWLGRFTAMMEAWPAADPFSIQPICFLQAILSEAIESQVDSVAARENVAWLQRAYELLAAAESMAMVSMDSIAEQMGMSYATFRKKFTALARMSPGRYHNLVVMRQACRFIHEESISSKEIADRLGFCNAYHFSRRFKEVVGMTASQYRQRLYRGERLSPEKPA